MIMCISTHLNRNSSNRYDVISFKTFNLIRDFYLTPFHGPRIPSHPLYVFFLTLSITYTHTYTLIYSTPSHSERNGDVLCAVWRLRSCVK